MSSRARSELRQINVRPSKRRGQNFVTDAAVIDAVVEFGSPSSDDCLLEIGPGLGALTERLVQFDRGMTAIEVEPGFCEKLKERFAGIDVICADVRKVDLSAIGEDLVVFGNVPYSFSTEIVFHLIEYKSAIRRAVLMLQREFAERMVAEPGGREYGVLSISCQLAACMRLGPVIGGDKFYPAARVDSRLIELSFRPGPSYQVEDPVLLRKVVQAAFQQRRKKLINSMRGSGFFSAERVTAALRACAIDGSRRAETLSIEEYLRLAAAMAEGD